jgi:hypothetical protein
VFEQVLAPERGNLARAAAFAVNPFAEWQATVHPAGRLADRAIRASSMTQVPEGVTIDSVIVTCRRDLRLLNLLLQSYSAFARVGGRLFIFHDPQDRDIINAMSIPPDTVLIDKSTVPGTRGDGYRDQMLIKLSIDKYSKAQYIWALDSDFLLVAPVFKEDFFCGDKPVWVYREWDNKASLVWREATEAMLGVGLPYQFMDRPQYLLSREKLAALRSRVSLERIFSSPATPSEYMLYAGFCHAYYRDTYYWSDSILSTSDLTFCVNQRPPSYLILDPTFELSQAGTSKLLAFWSHWELAEDKMRELLGAAISREAHSRLASLTNPFYTPVTVIEIQSGFGSVSGQFEDGWLKSNIRLALAPAPFDRFIFEIDALYTPNDSIICRISVDGQPYTKPLVTGFNRIEVRLSRSDTNYIEINFLGGVPEPGGVRMLSVRFIGAYFA